MNVIDHSGSKETCIGLLNLERAAFETYSQAIDFYKEDPLHSRLLSIRSAHDENLDYLSSQLGAWVEETLEPDSFPKAVEGAAAIFGEGAALMALEAGEAEAAHAYEEAISNPRLPRSLKDDLRGKLLPRLRANLLELEDARAEESAAAGTSNGGKA